jgi:hypothetical protein
MFVAVAALANTLEAAALGAAVYALNGDVVGAQVAAEAAHAGTAAVYALSCCYSCCSSSSPRGNYSGCCASICIGYYSARFKCSCSSC